MTDTQPVAKKVSPLLLTGLLAAVLLAAVLVFVQARNDEDGDLLLTPTAYSGAIYDPPLQLQPFTLVSSSGSPLSLSDLNGRWTLLTFGYTHCPDFCPTTMLDFKRVKSLLAERAAQVNFVLVSVDPQRDTPDVLAAYLSRYDPGFIGLVGDTQTLARIANDFALFYEVRSTGAPDENYLVDHSTRWYLIDPQGRLRVSYAFDTDPGIVAGNIAQFIAQG